MLLQRDNCATMHFIFLWNREGGIAVRSTIVADRKEAETNVFIVNGTFVLTGGVDSFRLPVLCVSQSMFFLSRNGPASGD